jgi:hypothetical protein
MGFDDSTKLLHLLLFYFYVKKYSQTIVKTRSTTIRATETPARNRMIAAKTMAMNTMIATETMARNRMIATKTTAMNMMIAMETTAMNRMMATDMA